MSKSDMDYYDWLKTQDESFQRFAISNEKHASMFVSGEMTKQEFGSLRISKTFKPLSLDDLDNLTY